MLHRFKIPDIVGLIIAGALIGPYGLHIMDRDSSIVLFGTVGLLYIMFVAGLEIDMADFKKNSKRSLIFGLYTFFIPMILGTFAGVYLLDFSYPTSILLASMFASHTLVTYPIVSKYGITKNRAVNVTIGGTVVTCLLALLVLAVIVGMSTGELTQGVLDSVGRINARVCFSSCFGDFLLSDVGISNDMMTEWGSLYLFWDLFFCLFLGRGGGVGGYYRGILGWISIKSSDTEYIGIDEPDRVRGECFVYSVFSDRGRNAGEFSRVFV